MKLMTVTLEPLDKMNVLNWGDNLGRRSWEDRRSPLSDEMHNDLRSEKNRRTGADRRKLVDDRRRNTVPYKEKDRRSNIDRRMAYELKRLVSAP